jgi:protein PhnA
MSLSIELNRRSEGKCELCSDQNTLTSFTVPPKSGNSDDDNIVICKTCLDQVLENEDLDINHWRCLNESMWSPVPAVQVVSYRMLKTLESEGWAQDALSMMYVDEPTLAWAQDGFGENAIVHKDCNGNKLSNGDTVVLIKDLDVKGSSLTAKRGVAVRRIRLVPDNATQIEGKVEGQQIVILTEFVKKSS